MTPGRILRVESTFVRKAKTRGGTGMEDAIAAAEGRVAAMSGQAMAEIDACLANAAEITASLAAGDASRLAELRASGDTLCGLCGLYGLDGLAQAAASLCALIDGVEGPYAKAVRVHLEAMQLFRHADAGMLAVSTGPVLEGLARVSTHLGVQGGEAAPAADAKKTVAP